MKAQSQNTIAKEQWRNKSVKETVAEQLSQNQSTSANHDCRAQLQSTIAKQRSQNNSFKSTVAEQMSQKPKKLTNTIWRHHFEASLQNTIAQQKKLKTMFANIPRNAPAVQNAEGKTLRKNMQRQFRGTPPRHNGIANDTIIPPSDPNDEADSIVTFLKQIGSNCFE